MKIGQFISFDLETWVNEDMIFVEFKAKISRLCIDPLNRHESKCIVSVNENAYGIPFSRIKEVFPFEGEQLTIFI